MNEQDELADLKAQQRRLEQELGSISLRLSRLERRLNAAQADRQEAIGARDLTPSQEAGAETNVVAEAVALEKPLVAAAVEAARLPAPGAVPPIISEMAAPQTATGATPSLPQPKARAEAPASVTAAGIPAVAEPAGVAFEKTEAQVPHRPAKPEKSLELRLGTYWAPRVGIVVLLTGLVFIGNLAYQRVGALGKVLMLYAASGVLLGAGSWWQQNGKAALKNYAQVLFAGGLAALYFTTYAAHHLESLRVIQSARLDGVLLLGCAGFMVWTADRWRSEILAVFGVGLAYYSCVMTRVGYFTLYSNLLLTIAAVVFLVRNRWVALSFGSLVASYAAYGFWRFFSGSHWHWASPAEGLWFGTYFLFSYWAVFTAGVFLSKEHRFAGETRAAFLTLNNGAMFALFVLTMLQVSTGGFWKFCLAYGGVLLALALTAGRVLVKEPLAKNAYLTQGLLLVTIGFISKFAGLQLGLILAAESVVLLQLAYQKKVFLAAYNLKSLVLLVAAYIVAALGVGWGIDGMRQFEPASWYLGCGLGALMLVNTLIAHRRSQLGENAVLRPQVAYFVVLALTAWWATTWNQSAREHFPLVLACEGALFALSIYLIGIFELCFFGLVYLLIGEVAWGVAVFGPGFWPAWWNPVAMLVIAMGISYWWQRQHVSPLRARKDDPWPALDKMPAAGKNLVLLAVAWLGATLAGGGAILNAGLEHERLFCLPLALGAMALGDALLAARREQAATATVRLQPGFSTAVALLIWLAVTWQHTERVNFALVLAGEGLLLTLSIYLLRVREVPLLSQGYLVLAQLAWVFTWLDRKMSIPWWNPLLLIGLTLLLSHWWQKQKVLPLAANALRFWQGMYALAIVGVIYFWLGQTVGTEVWLALTGLLAVGLTIYAVATRAWLLGACAQLFNLASLAEFARQLSEGHPAWHLALAPMASLALLSWGTERWYGSRPGAESRVRDPLLKLAVLYRWVALIMVIAWVWEYIPSKERIWVLSALGLAAFAFAGWKRSGEALLFVTVFTVLALTLFWAAWQHRMPVYWGDLVAPLALLSEQQAAKRLSDRYRFDARIHGAIIFIGGLSVWIFCTRWVMDVASGFYLTASWSLLALAFFTCGIVVRERVYRWLGLGLLACALGRIVIFDVWKLETLYRILSFMALGIVLLVLGFVYSKYQEKIKEWL
ncbi:MAG TPA: DUF2339 domain-containing protein [Verrucomicrobiae bacterium]